MITQMLFGLTGVALMVLACAARCCMPAIWVA